MAQVIHQGNNQSGSQSALQEKTAIAAVPVQWIFSRQCRWQRGNKNACGSRRQARNCARIAEHMNREHLGQ